MDIAKTLEKGLKEYDSREIEVNGKKYSLYIIPELSDPDLNLYEGFFFILAEDRRELTFIKNYQAPMSGYTPRISFVLYSDKLLIKDHRKNKHIIRSLNKINESFINKIKKAVTKPSESSFHELFDRKDVIEDFYELFNKTREYLVENIKGIAEEDKRIEFADDFLMQMMTLWYLQARGFFNNDEQYLITKFHELSQRSLTGKGFGSYKEFLEYFFEKISDNETEQYYEDDLLGRVVVIGPAIFIGTDEEFEIVDIPDKCFYQENITEDLINENPDDKTEIPILNLFESRDWIDGDIDEYVLGALYEKLITEDRRKETGSYYTPEEITSYIAWNTIEPYLLRKVDKDYKSIDDLIEDADPETLRDLFTHLKDIKILDPAVGSGHFLESAVDVLVEIYQKLRDKAKKIGLKGFEIVVTDENGELRRIDLLDIDNDRFNLYLKFFIILSRNIYGVDINSSALKVARARFFLSMAKHFRPSKDDSDIFVRFPNVHFNLREGNSLIGYDSIGKDSVDLFSFSRPLGTDKRYIADKINILDDLREYLEVCSDFIGLKGDIGEDINDLNRIFAMDKLKWSEIERVLRIKEKLVSILIVSLNSRQAAGITDLLDSIDKIFYTKFDEKFSEDYNITVDKIRELNAFHWILEFPEVCLERNGFDVVIGNPPYVRQERIKELKPHLKKHYRTYHSVADLLVYFFERGIEVLKPHGMFSYIVSNKFTRARYGGNLREYLVGYSIKKYNDYTGENVFKGVTVDVSIIVIQKTPPHDNRILVDESFEMPQEKLNKESWIFEREEVLDLKEKIENIGKPLKEWPIKIYFGIKTGFNKAFIIDDEKRREILENCGSREERERTGQIIKPLLRGRDIKRYSYDWKNSWLILIKAGWTNAKRGDKNPENFFKEYYPAIYDHLVSFSKIKGKGKGLFERDDQGDYWWELRPCDYYHEFEKEKIVWQRVTQQFSFSLVPKGFYVLDSMAFITGDNIRYLVGILNSKLVDFYVRTYVHEIGDKGFLLSNQYVERIPIPPITKENKDSVDRIEDLADQILELNKQKKFIQDTFKGLVENTSREKTPLREYLEPKNAPDYNPARMKKLVDDDKEAIPREYRVRGGEDYLVLSVAYNDEVEDALKIYFDDQTIKEFFHLAIHTSVANKKLNYRSKKKVLDEIMAIEMPRLEKNVETIKNLMKILEKEYEKEFHDPTLNLDRLDKKIHEVDKQIDELVYELYGLNEEEKRIVEEVR